MGLFRASVQAWPKNGMSVVQGMAHYSRFIIDTCSSTRRAGLQDQFRAGPGQGHDGGAGLNRG
jgi:hypothetical protein